MKKINMLCGLIGLSLYATYGYCDNGFSAPYTMQFKLNSTDAMIATEAMRQNLNAAARSGAGSLEAQSQANTANYINWTTNNDIILNGDANTVTVEPGKIDQLSSGTQSANNEINKNSQNTAATGTSSVANGGN